jgi:hypothetical protein
MIDHKMIEHRAGNMFSVKLTKGMITGDAYMHFKYDT